MACAEPRLTALKIGYKGEIHRIRVDLSVFKLEDLNALFMETFSLAPNSFVIQYKDMEGDCLNVCSEAEYVEACRVFLTGADAVKSLRFVAASRNVVAFQENVAAPILKAIEKLVETLNSAMEKVKNEEWAQRAQNGVEQTSEAVKSAAKSAASEARESFAAARQTIQELPFEQVLKDTADGIKIAAEGIGSFAQEIVEEIKNMTQSQTTSVVHEDVEESNNLTEEQDVANEEVVDKGTEPEDKVEVAEPTRSSGSDSEWEQVSQTVPPNNTSAVVPEPVVVIPAPMLSPEEQKWAEQLATIRSIFPDVQTQRVIDALEQCNGNLEVVVNALMEDM